MVGRQFQEANTFDDTRTHTHTYPYIGRVADRMTQTCKEVGGGEGRRARDTATPSLLPRSQGSLRFALSSHRSFGSGDESKGVTRTCPRRDDANDDTEGRGEEGLEETIGEREGEVGLANGPRWSAR